MAEHLPPESTREPAPPLETPHPTRKAEPSSSPLTDPEFILRRFKEYVTAAIAGLVLLGMVVVLIIAIRVTESFDQLKDILLILNPLVGVVLGYYFTKVSTEARAENAEATAKTAVANAEQATKARDEVQTELSVTTHQVQETRAALKDLAQASEKFLAPPALEKGGILGDDNAGDVSFSTGPSEARHELEAALQRARHLLE